ncbi:MAG: cysteine hydrolase family protein [Candidatus Sulfotelmatobacter sp.]|jgi:nicotinamidase-related amidase
MSAEKTALLVIDVQRGILNDPILARKKEINQAFDETVLRIAGLIARARTASVPVIYIQHDGGPGHRLEPETSGWPIRPEIAPHPGEPVIHKRACDAFFETTLDAELTAARIKQLVICGCMTQYCVDTTVRRSVSLGYDVILVADGHMTADTETLRFEQIIAHHNSLLDGFDAGEHEVRVCASSEIRL